MPGYKEVDLPVGENGGGKVADVGLEIPPGKFDYLFGRSVSNEDNAAGSNQLALEIKRLGVPDTLSGQQMLSEHLTQSVKAEGNVVNTFSNQYETFEVRESLFMGPSGKAANLQSTFQILPDGTRRLSTVIPRHQEQKMKFPSELDSLESFGIEPVEVDASMACCRYVKTSDDGAVELDFSFSAVSESFQVVLRCAGHEMASVSSENASLIEIRATQRGTGIHVVFDARGGKSEAEMTLEPSLHCSWWYVRD